MKVRPTGNALVVYGLLQHPLRGTIRDHLYSFQRYSRLRCSYVNLGLHRVPRTIAKQQFDLVIFHTSFLATLRWSPTGGQKLLERAQPLKGLGGVSVALPQDEFLRSEPIAAFIDEFGIDHVFSTATESEWPKIYQGVDRERVGFSTVLTGYLEDRTVARCDDIARGIGKRPLDIGYRAWRGSPWVGRHGLLKGDLAEAVRQRAPRKGLSIDISTRDEDTVFGDDWLRFLASSKYTIGVEGGASVLDRDGSIRACTERYLADRPEASFDEVEAHCFPGEDGKLSLFAISPRHLEACATRTCQILVEGAYNGVLEPGRHYIELRRDLSNLDAVLDIVRHDDQREAITHAAYEDVVRSGHYSYRQFVRLIEERALGGTAADQVSRGIPVRYLLARARDAAARQQVSFLFRVVLPVYHFALRAAARVLPEALLSALRRRIAARIS